MTVGAWNFGCSFTLVGVVLVRNLGNLNQLFSMIWGVLLCRPLYGVFTLA